MADEQVQEQVEVKVPKLALFPVYLYEEGFEPPKTGTYYLVSKTGIYLHKETKAGNALVPVKGIPWLEEPTLEFRLKLPKVPALIIGQAWTFFNKVFTKYASESYVTLLYSAKLKEYQLWCPKQKVSFSSVNYDRTDQPSYEDRQTNDWQMVGTIHSHCNFSAYHSGTDEHDESTFDGIHITIGHVDRKQFSLAASIAINEVREKLEPENCCVGIFPAVSQQSDYGYMNFNDTRFFELQLSEEEAQQLAEVSTKIEEEWMPKVEKEQWGYSKKNGSGLSDFGDDFDFNSPGGQGRHRTGWFY